MLPRRVVTVGAGGAEGRPVTTIKKDLQARSLGKLARFDVEDDDPGLYGGIYIRSGSECNYHLRCVRRSSFDI